MSEINFRFSSLMPLAKYKLHKKSLQDSINLNLTSLITNELPSSNSLENNHKRQRIESMEQDILSESTIIITTPNENLNKQPHKKKTKTKPSEDLSVQQPVVQPTLQPIVVKPVSEPPVIKPISQSPVVKPAPQILKEKVIEKDVNTDAPISLSSANGRIRELKSKTPTWKAQPPVAKANPQSNNYNLLE